MRYLLDTNIFLLIANDPDKINPDIQEIIYNYENELCMSSESLRELIIGYNNRKYETNKWKTCEEVVLSVSKEYGIQVLPLDKKVMQTYSNLKVNVKQDHHDPSDHIIISHALTLKIPLISTDTKFPFYRQQGLELLFNKKN